MSEWLSTRKDVEEAPVRENGPAQTDNETSKDEYTGVWDNFMSRGFDGKMTFQV